MASSHYVWNNWNSLIFNTNTYISFVLSLRREKESDAKDMCVYVAPWNIIIKILTL